jgi:hypothetical protein
MKSVILEPYLYELIFHDGSDTHACVPKRHFGVQARTM